MSEYTPDKWIVLKITTQDHSPIYKVFACWYGGYLDGDSWKLNSGITKAILEKDIYSFEGSSGSIYHCHKNSYGTNLYGEGVLNNLISKMQSAGTICQVLSEETNWLEINYE